MEIFRLHTNMHVQTLDLMVSENACTNFGSYGFRKEDFSCISHYKPMADNHTAGQGLYGSQ